MMRCFMAALAMMLWCAGRADAASCTVSTTSVSFGSYSVFAAPPTDSTGNVTFRCSGNATVMITISAGQSGTFNPRKLANGTQQLSYNLHRDTSQTVVWGDGSGGTQTYTQVNVPNNTNITVTVYGRIPAGQDVPAGSYADSVSITVNF